jgi:hypothetical protein
LYFRKLKDGGYGIVADASFEYELSSLSELMEVLT